MTMAAPLTSRDDKPTVILDFDGTIHLYNSGWKGVDVIPDLPTVGCREAVELLRRRYRVVVVSTRCNEPAGIAAIWAWLRLHQIEVDDVARDKPASLVTVDDRALRFEGNWNEILGKIDEAAVPWFKRTRRRDIVAESIEDMYMKSIRQMLQFFADKKPVSGAGVGMYLWVLVRDLLGTGPMQAYGFCRQFHFDPEMIVEPPRWLEAGQTIVNISDD
jgi:hypothetical protein